MSFFCRLFKKDARQTACVSVPQIPPNHGTDHRDPTVADVSPVQLFKSLFLFVLKKITLF